MTLSELPRTVTRSSIAEPADGIDAVGLLTFWLAVVFIIPMRWVFPVIGAAGRPGIVVGYACLGWWLVSRLVPRMVVRGAQPIRWAFALFLTVVFIAYGLALVRGMTADESSGAQRTLIVMMSLLGCGLLVADGVPSRQRLDTLLLRLIYLASFSAFIGALQFFLTKDYQTLVRFPGLVVSGTEPLSGIDVRGGFNRVSGTGGHPIEFGSVMAMMLPIALHYVVHSPPDWRRWARMGALAMIAVGIPASLSRSAILALTAVFLGMFVIWSRHFALRVFVGVVGAIIALQLLRPNLINTFIDLFTKPDEDGSLSARTDDYDIVFTEIAHRPWFGRGPGTFGPPEFILLDNEVLGTLASTGYVGLVALLSMYVVAMALGRRVVFSAVDDEARHLAQALVASVFAGMIILYFVDAFFYAIYTSTLFLLFGALGALYRMRDQSKWGAPASTGFVRWRLSAGNKRPAPRWARETLGK